MELPWIESTTKNIPCQDEKGQNYDNFTSSLPAKNRDSKIKVKT